MIGNSDPKKAVRAEVNSARRSFIQATGVAAGLLLTGCGGGSGGGSQTSTTTVIPIPAEEITIPPVVTLQPSDQTVNPGESARFEVDASGTQSATYQWQKNGINIPGATETAYVTPPLVLQDSGAAYAVLVSNDAGAVQSDAAIVVVSTARVTVDSISVTVDALAAINQ